MSEQSDTDRIFSRGAKWLLAHGVHPNHFTFLQLPVFAFQIAAAQAQWAWPFVLGILFVILLDGGDGILARVGKLQSRSGAVLDSLFDTFGIAIVMWGAARFFPAEAGNWLMLLFVGNLLLFLQNALLGQKAIAYVRGPVLAGVVFPQTQLAALVIPIVILLFLLVVRLGATAKALKPLAAA